MKNTLSPVRGRNKVVTSLDPHLRLAIDGIADECGHEFRAETLRLLIVEALTARGVTEKQAQEKYLEYKLGCVKSGNSDQYENGEL